MKQPYPNLDTMVRHHRVVLPTPRETWRLVADPVVGSINGIDHIRGGSVATNGIMVALLNEVDVLTFGHLDWFVPDETEKNVELSDLWSDAKVPVKNKIAVLKDYTDY